MRNLQMPILRPLPIPTQGRSWPMRLWIWWSSARRWDVAKNWEFTLPDGTMIVIPAGFVFDGASIPRPLWWLLSPTGLLLIPGLVHDYAYRYDELLAAEQWFVEEIEGGNRRRHWDRLFREIAIQVNGTTVIDCVAYWMLRAFGWVAWNRHRRREEGSA